MAARMERGAASLSHWRRLALTEGSSRRTSHSAEIRLRRDTRNSDTKPFPGRSILNPEIRNEQMVLAQCRRTT